MHMPRRKHAFAIWLRCITTLRTHSLNKKVRVLCVPPDLRPHRARPRRRGAGAAQVGLLHASTAQVHHSPSGAPLPS